MRGRFWVKVAGAAGLVMVADHLLLGERWGWTLGLFALAWIAVVALASPAVRRLPVARGGLALAAGFALVLTDDPSLLTWTLFWGALSVAVLWPIAAIDDAVTGTVRLLVHGVVGLAQPFRDLARQRRVRARRGGGGAATVVRLLALPIGGGLVFAALFAGANPLIGRTVQALDLPDVGTVLVHTGFAALVLMMVWPSLRPVRVRVGVGIGEDGDPAVRLPVATLVLSLAVFNAVFAVENALDLAFLWSGAVLPEGVTLADYAHRGAYLLIVTALLSGAFVLIALHPSSEAVRDGRVRVLLTLWLAQNILLVASSMRRLGDYVAAYSLTELRIGAFVWMALVVTGLVLIGWRMLNGRSSRWLVNANVAAAAVALSGAAVVDFGAVAAAWNVNHARDLRALDLCYLERLGSSALVPLARLERRVRGEVSRDQIAALRADAYTEATRGRGDWHAWTWRDARRADAVDALLGATPAKPVRGRRECGVLIPPDVPVEMPRMVPSVTPTAPGTAPSPSLAPLTPRVAS
ncbi:MAG TPA: DUF4173 domain-containing protein [Sphingomonas sp.]|jgi:hypothetical protein